MKTNRFALFAFLLACGIALHAAGFSATVPAVEAATTTPGKHGPDPSKSIPKRGNARFFELHESFLKRAKSGPVDLLFLGDSITEYWSKYPEIWEKAYGRYRPANFGSGGDRTQHVIWRIENGELDGISPKVLILLVGTNNTGNNTAEQIAAADRKIVALIRAKLPDTKILLLAIFPRGPRTHNGRVDPWEEQMAKIRVINVDLASLEDGKHIRFLDIGSAFLAPDGSIPDDVMPDHLHPSAKGYEIWVKAMQPLLDEMMQE